MLMYRVLDRRRVVDPGKEFRCVPNCTALFPLTCVSLASYDLSAVPVRVPINAALTVSPQNLRLIRVDQVVQLRQHDLTDVRRHVRSVERMVPLVQRVIHACEPRYVGQYEWVALLRMVSEMGTLPGWMLAARRAVKSSPTKSRCGSRSI